MWHLRFSQQRLWMWHRTVWQKLTDTLEEHAASVIRSEELTERSKKKWYKYNKVRKGRHTKSPERTKRRKGKCEGLGGPCKDRTSRVNCGGNANGPAQIRMAAIPTLIICEPVSSVFQLNMFKFQKHLGSTVCFPRRNSLHSAESFLRRDSPSISQENSRLFCNSKVHDRVLNIRHWFLCWAKWI